MNRNTTKREEALARAEDALRGSARLSLPQELDALSRRSLPEAAPLVELPVSQGLAVGYTVRNNPALFLTLTGDQMREAQIDALVLGNLPMDNLQFMQRVRAFLPTLEAVTRGPVNESVTRAGSELDESAGACRGSRRTELQGALRRLFRLVDGHRSVDPQELVGSAVEIVVRLPGKDAVYVAAGSNPDPVAARLHEAAAAALRKDADYFRIDGVEARDESGPVQNLRGRLATLSHVVGLRRLGYTSRHIEMHLPINADILKPIFRGVVPRSVLRFDPEHDWKRAAARTEHHLPYSPEAAYLLGVYYAVRQGDRRHRHQGAVFFTPAKDRDQALKQALRAAAPAGSRVQQGAAVVQGKRYERLFVASKSFNRTLNRVSDHARRLAVEHVADKAETLGFLRGFCRNVGCITGEGVKFVLNGRPRLAVEIASLFERVGVVPLVTLTPRPSLEFSSRRELEALQELDVFTRKDDRDRLARAISAMGKSRSWSAADYNRFCELRLDNPTASISKLARDLGIPRNTVDSWDKGKKPREVMRLDALWIARQELGLADAAAVALLVRRHGIAWRDAEAAVGDKSLAVIQKNLAGCQALNLPWQHNLTLLSYSEEALRSILGAGDDEPRPEVAAETDVPVDALEAARRARVITRLHELGVAVASYEECPAAVFRAYRSDIDALARSVANNPVVRALRIEAEDIVYCALVALRSRIRSWDPALIADPFSCLAPKIKGEMLNEVRRQAPRSSSILNITRAIGGMTSPPSVDEIISHCQVSRAAALAALTLHRSRLSPDSTAGKNEHGLREPPRAEPLEDEVRRVLHAAAPGERLVAVLHFAHKFTLEELSLALGESRSRIRDVVSRFLERIKSD